jgi:hypothetical protein
MSNIITAGNATNNGTSISSDTSGVLELKTGSTPTTAIAVDASQNVGIGTNSPSSKFVVSNGGAVGFEINPTGIASAPALVSYNRSGAAYTQLTTLALQHVWQNSGSEVARIDSSGNLLVGKTTTATTALGWSLGSDRGNAKFSAGNYMIFNRDDNDILINFRRSDSSVGTITVNTTNTAYNTSSDYRLKEDIQPMTGGLAKVAALKPVTYKWKADGSDGEGFIAHELAEVCPHAVTGEKDAVDAEGKPVYQGIDVSFLVGTLTAALQEAHGLIKDLTTRLEKLEAK